MVVTILLADDHPIVRQGMRRLLEAETGFQVVGEAEDGLQAVEMVRRLRPQILVVDLMMPGLNGLEAARQVTRHSPSTRILMFTMQRSAPYVLESFRAGVFGYVLKDTGPAELTGAVRAVIGGERYLSPSLDQTLIDRIMRGDFSDRADPFERLTEREREVLQMTAEGYSHVEVADRLGISPRTAERHRQNLMDKLNLHSRAELVRFAIRTGILNLE